MAGRPKRSKADPDPYPPGWEPFLAAINAHLDDDTPRLVFADWLQENGDEPRAEFVRLQCAAARGDTSAAKRADALLKGHRTRWLRGLPKWCIDQPGGCVFRRGFVAAMTVRGRHWLRSPFDKPRDAGGQAIRRITALEELRIEQVWNTVVESRTLAGIRSLILPSAGSALIESLAKSPALPSLTSLAIEAKSSDGVSQRSFRQLFATDQLAGLRRFRVESVPLGLVIVVGLWVGWFAGLEELRLRHVSLDAAGVQALVLAPAVANLRVLDLLNNPLGDDGLRHLLAAPALRNLEELCLSLCDLTAASARSLAAWEGLRTVRRLDLMGNELGAAEARLIKRSPHARNLTDLRVGGSQRKS
jgi:uncharacterized protein (TIGR02996 family)